MKHWYAIAVFAFATTGCLSDREGPSADDNGSILYWELHTFDTEFDGCSDSPDSPTNIDAPEFQENSFFVYRIADDGSQAITQDCTTTDGSTCTDSTEGIVLIRNRDNTYSWDPAEVVLGNAAVGCTVLGDELWVFTDNGEEGDLAASVTYRLQGQACTAYDDGIKQMSPNGLGVDGCTVTIRANLDHFSTW